MTRYLLLILAFLAPAAIATEALEPFEAVYTVRMSAARGEMRMDLASAEDELTGFSSLRPRGLARLFASGRVDEWARFTVVDGRVVPGRYDMTDTIGRNDKSANMTFDWQAGRASGRDEDGEFEHPIDRQTYDRASIQYALMLDLASGRRPERYTMLDGDRLKKLAVSYEDGAVIDVPNGEYEVVRVQHRAEGSRRRTVLYCAPDLGYLPVRIEQYKDDKLKVRAELKSYTAR